MFFIFYLIFILYSTKNAYSHSGAQQGLIGNSVEIGDGPAAVIGDEHRIHVTVCMKQMGRRGN